jgi:gliding motility-associated protein GldM
MAGGNLSARQKMINLMYLVFIAMLALQIDREVLRAFSDTNDTLEATSTMAGENNKLFYDNLKTKASKNATIFGPLYRDALKVKAQSDQIYNHIQQIKIDISTGLVKNNEGEIDYKALETTEVMDKLFFNGEKPTERANDFKSKLEKYSGFLTTISKSSDDKGRIEKVFNTKDTKDRKWLNSKFYEQPLIASLTRLSKYQADIRSEENNLISKMLANKLEDEIVLRKFTAITAGPRILTIGKNEKLKIAFGAYDNSLTGSVNVEGSNIPLKDGSAEVTLNASSVGDKSLSGVISYTKLNGKTESEKFTFDYKVVAATVDKIPASATISADKMNVVYRGVTNPMSASVSGAKDGTVRLSASNGSISSAGNGKWNYRAAGGTEVTFKVTATAFDGKPITKTMAFRIKDIPAPRGTVRGSFEPKMPRSSLIKSDVGAEIPGFEFPVNIIVTSFTVKLSGLPSVKVSGSEMDARAKDLINKAKPGDIISIIGIQATLQDGGGILLPKISPIVVELTN